MTGGTGAVSTSGGGAPAARSKEPDSGVGTAFQGWEHVSCLELTALPKAVSCGRLHTKQVLWEWQLAYLAEDAEILASELLSNAVKASWSPEGLGFTALVHGVSDSTTTVGQVIELYEQGRLMDIPNISSGRAGEIQRGAPDRSTDR